MLWLMERTSNKKILTSKKNKTVYGNIRKIATGQGDDYSTDCLLYYAYFRDAYKTERL